jgi:hypothetical protein
MQHLVKCLLDTQQPNTCRSCRSILGMLHPGRRSPGTDQRGDRNNDNQLDQTKAALMRSGGSRALRSWNSLPH